MAGRPETVSYTHLEGIAVRRGRYGDAGAVIGGDVLHDGKPQPRAARRLAAALVDAVEPFKDTLGVFRRNGLARVEHAQTPVSYTHLSAQELWDFELNSCCT